MLGTTDIVAFIPTTDFEKARSFYEHMGWTLDESAGVRDDPWAPEVRYETRL